MKQFLDLRIELTSPIDTPSNGIASIAVHCDLLDLHHTGMILYDPLTQQERADLHWYLEEYWQWPYEGFAIRGQQIEAFLPDLGKRFYEAVFGVLKTEGAFQSWLTSDASRQISIMSTLPQVLSLPWELLHDEQGFLVLHPSQPISIVRCFSPQERTMLSISFKPPLRILILSPRPMGAGFIDPRSIVRELLEEVQNQIDTGTIDLELLYPPTFRELEKRLKDQERPVHILHFDGHGIFDARQKQGMLAFEDEGERLDLIKASDVSAILRQSGVRLVILTACQSAVSAADDPLSSVAAQLLQGMGTIDAVVAMSASLLDISATRYTEAFYHTLAAGLPIQVAHERARQALSHNTRRHLYRRYQGEEGIPVELSDWWLPHFYQQTPLFLQASVAETPLEKRVMTHSHRLSADMPAVPRYGFTGRERELLKIERELFRGKLVVISGVGGMGKTALAREAADWLTRTMRYAGACFISFEHGGDASYLLSLLGNYLDIDDVNYKPSEPEAALAYLGTDMKGKKILVIADNLESILSYGETSLEVNTHAQLWDTLLALKKLGMGVLLTSRGNTVKDELIARGARVTALRLAGLLPDEAYALATHLLTDLSIDRTRAPYNALHTLLLQLDHHPLAIQLVLPALREHSLDVIRAELAALLPTFMDDTATGRNRSLLASLDYSLHRLTPEQHALLPRLTPFEGGANEASLLIITEIPEDDWVIFREALSQAGLLTTEEWVAGTGAPFLRFHPVLTPYLRDQQSRVDTTLHARHALGYASLAADLASRDGQQPQAVRTLVQKELPNLHRALVWLLSNNLLEVASHLAERMTHFLTTFGLLHERDKIQQLMSETIASQHSQKQGVLTSEEFFHESSLGENERQRGDLDTATTRFANLLTRIEALPEGAEYGRGSYSHCLTLAHLARCLRDDLQPALAEKYLRQALAFIEGLRKQQPENTDRIHLHSVLLANFADVLRNQGQYTQSQENYKKSLEIARQNGDLRQFLVALGQLGSLALLQHHYVEAKSYYQTVLKSFHMLREQSSEAIIWHQLGLVAEAQQDWAEAEHCYRESLKINELVGNIAASAKNYMQLASVAEKAGKKAESDEWYRRALERFEQANPESPK